MDDVDFDMNKFIAMNRFKIAIGRESDFEDIWQNRETHLDDEKVFKIQSIEGSTGEEFTLYTFFFSIVLGNLKLILKIGKIKVFRKHTVEGTASRHLFRSS